MSAFTHRVVSSAFAFVRGPAVYGIRIGALAERRRSETWKRLGNCSLGSYSQYISFEALNDMIKGRHTTSLEQRHDFSLHILQGDFVFVVCIVKEIIFVDESMMFVDHLHIFCAQGSLFNRI